MPRYEKHLRGVLTANAIFSLVSGLSMVFFHEALAGMMGIANGKVLIGVGLGLLLFGLTVMWAARRKALSNTQIKSIIFQDWAWVVASAAVIGLQAWDLSATGYWMIGIVALLVADFAIFQARFLKKLG